MPDPQPVVRATIDSFVQHDASKRIEADCRLAPKLPALRFVTSDFNPANGKLILQPAGAAAERAEIAWFRAANPNAYVVACAMNLWNGRSYAPITPADAREWAWFALDRWGDQVDCFRGPNEADSRKYNGMIRAGNSNRADAVRHPHALWAEAAVVFMAAGIPTGGPVHILPDSTGAWERDYGQVANVVTCHDDVAQLVLDFAQQADAMPEPQVDDVESIADREKPLDLRDVELIDARAIRSGRQKLTDAQFDQLPVIRIEHDPPEDRKPCSCCGEGRVKMGSESSWQLEYVPGHFERIENVRLKYACSRCEENAENPNIELADKPRQQI